MSINYAILGILSYQPLTGYDLKKIIQDSPFMYWSGNNNQIYKSLVELLEEGLVTNEVQHQESSPSKKIYTITQAGLAELKNWVLSTPEAPEFKKTFLIQLAWADLLSADEFNTFVSGYENQVKIQLLMQKEYLRRRNFSPDRTPRERSLWDLIHENLIAAYETELNWIQKVRREICLDKGKETNQMQVQVIEKAKGRYIQCISAKTPLSSEQDAVELLAICGENDTNHLIINAEALSDDFFKLRTGVAGQMLQKFINYHVQIAVMITNESMITGKFKEMVAESNKRNDFRVFTNISDAENWFFN
jgi:PadR family transcriptional regulator AphA